MSNHIFEPVRALQLSEFAVQQYGFLHQSFYEYYVSVALIHRITAGRPLGLEIDRLSMTTIDSLAFAFAKELGGTALRKAVRQIVCRPRLDVSDRLILLYFLEDEEDFTQLIESIPGDYLDNLTRLEANVASFFLKKMIRYQLVIAGRYDAQRYVEEVRAHEDEGGLRAELRLHSTETGVTEQLLRRLQNESLSRARLITIYRLGQLGNERALDALKWAKSLDKTLATAASEAISNIQKRR